MKNSLGIPIDPSSEYASFREYGSFGDQSGELIYALPGKSDSVWSVFVLIQRKYSC